MHDIMRAPHIQKFTIVGIEPVASRGPSSISSPTVCCCGWACIAGKGNVVVARGISSDDNDDVVVVVVRGSNEKKRFASLRFCVSSLHRDHANLLCIVKRLFNARAETRAIRNAYFKYINKVGI